MQGAHWFVNESSDYALFRENGSRLVHTCFVFCLILINPMSRDKG